MKRLQLRIAQARKDGRPGKVRALQGLLTHSWSAKLVAVKRVVTNDGHDTPGIDGVRWSTPEDWLQAAQSLHGHGYHPQPLRRVYIPKKNGKRRPLGIPTLQDRAMQALYTLALTPVAETTADWHSYGFREYRSTADAIAQCFICLAQKSAGRWILEGDIRACFEEIRHDWLLAHTPLPRAVLRQWLAAGYLEQGTLYPTHAGTPQGGIISPTLANLTLDGMEATVREAAGRQTAHVIRYADDFVVIAHDRTLLAERILPALTAFLAVRGLTLSPEKTVITSVDEGVDFLGQHLRKYRGKLLIKPAKGNVRAFLTSVRRFIHTHRPLSPTALILALNRKIRGWANYHRHIVASDTYRTVDRAIFMALFAWAQRRHPKHSRRWVYQRYFTQGPARGVFATPTGSTDTPAVLYRAAQTPIRRHIKIRGAANPYAREDASYFALRRRSRNVLDPTRAGNETRGNESPATVTS